MADITAIILTRNEKDFIEECILSIKDVVKRIVVVDSFSEDNTCELAKKLGADRLVFHSCYYEDIYFKETYINNSLEFWNEFLSDKDASVKIYIENMYEKDLSVLKELFDKLLLVVDITATNNFKK